MQFQPLHGLVAINKCEMKDTPDDEREPGAVPKPAGDENGVISFAQQDEME